MRIGTDDVQEHAEAITGEVIDDDLRAEELAWGATQAAREYLDREIGGDTIDATVEDMTDEAEEAIREHDTDPHDAIFEAVDSWWGALGLPVGLIDSWPQNPGADVLTRCAEVLDYCEEEAWLADDSGLWEGLNGAAVVGAQAFHSLQNVVWEKLRERGVIAVT